MKSTDIESLLSSELEEVKGGTNDVCNCTSGAGQTVVIIKQPSEPSAPDKLT
jgi:hypothetical protein